MPSHRTPRLRLQLLGEMQVTLDGTPLGGKVYGKVLALLAFLAVEGNRSHSRERLADLLWPDLAPEAARANLRQSLYNLRRALGDEEGAAFVTAGRDAIRFHPESPCWIDLRDFTLSAGACPPARTPEQCAACLAGMERRAALYRGEFLAGVTVDDAPEFEEWRDAWRESLHRQALGLIERLRQCHEHQGALDRALSDARRYTELEPWDEEGHRQLMRLLALNGQRGAALAQYEACRVLLERELAVAPEPETQRLFARIRDGVLEPERGATVPDAPPPEAPARRQVTVLYGCFTATGESDPEEIAERLRAPQQQATEIVRQQGAHLAPTHGGTLLAYFGYPAAFEDAARRAVRAALALTRATAEGVTLRIGVHTGIIVTGADPRLPDAVGVASKVAMRLCDRAAPGDLVISHTTHPLVAGYFHQTPLDPQRLAETSEPIRPFRVTGETGACGRLDATARLLPLVGRRTELGTLKALWAETWQGRGHRVVLRGEAGMGKSRLLRALRENLAGVPWSIREIQGYPEYSQTPLHPVIVLLERLLAFGAEETPAARRAILDAYLHTYHATLRDEAYPLVAALLGIADAPLALTPEVQKEKSAEILLKLLGDAARQQPLLLAVEDIHWLDPSTLGLLEMAVKMGGDAPILSVYTTRPCLAPPWLLEGSVVIDLAPLTEAEVTTLVRETEAELSEETVCRIVARADGVPLFAEEMARMASEPALVGEIPDTLHYLLLARLDALPRARRVAQLAATLGRRFDRDVLRDAAGVDDVALAAALQILQEARLIHPTGESDSTFQFRHALIQEAAYQSQTKADRQSAHRRIAEALTTHFPQRAAQAPEQVARHYTAAGLPAEALPWWLAAGRGDLHALAHAEAAEHLRSGLALIDKLPAGPGRDALELDLLLPLGQALLRLRGYGSADAAMVYDRAIALCAGAPPLHRFEALWGLWMVSSSRADSSFAESERLARELLEAAQATARPVLLGYAHAAAANVALWQGELGAACRAADAAIAAATESERRAERLDGHDPTVAALSYLSWARLAQGRITAAVDASEEAIACARRLDQPDTLGFALVHAATLRRYLRDAPRVAQLSQETLDLAGHYGLPLWQGAGATMLGWAQVASGDTKGLELLNAGAAGVRQIMPGILVAFLHPLAEACGTAGQSEAQLAAVEEALAAAARLHDGFHLAELQRLRGEALVRLGRDNEAIEALREALRISEAQGARAFRLRAAVPLAALLRARGAEPEGRALLQSALTGFGPADELPDLCLARSALR